MTVASTIISKVVLVWPVYGHICTLKHCARVCGRAVGFFLTLFGSFFVKEASSVTSHESQSVMHALNGFKNESFIPSC